MKKLFLTLAISILVVSCAPEVKIDPRDAYYKGIYDYCLNVTIVDVPSGVRINRDEAYCSALIEDYREREFYERYNEFPSPGTQG